MIRRLHLSEIHRPSPIEFISPWRIQSIFAGIDDSPRVWSKLTGSEADRWASSRVADITLLIFGARSDRPRLSGYLREPTPVPSSSPRTYVGDVTDGLRQRRQIDQRGRRNGAAKAARGRVVEERTHLESAFSSSFLLFVFLFLSRPDSSESSSPLSGYEFWPCICPLDCF